MTDGGTALDGLRGIHATIPRLAVEHRLQVTFSRLMLEALFAAEQVTHDPTRTGILF